MNVYISVLFQFRATEARDGQADQGRGGGDARAGAGRGGTGVPPARRRARVARGGGRRGRRDARRDLPPLREQGRALRGDAGAGRDADRHGVRCAAAAGGRPPGDGARHGREGAAAPGLVRRACATSSRSRSCAASTPTNSAPVEQRHLQEREQCLALSNGLLDQAVARGQLPAGHRHAHGVAHALRLHRRPDARLGAGAGELRPEVAAPQAVDLFLAGLRAAPPRRARPSGA